MHTTVCVDKTLGKLLKVEAKRLGFHSINAFVQELFDVRLAMGWSREDLFCLKTWKKIPFVVTGSSAEECAEKLGVLKVKEMPKSSEFSESMPQVSINVKPKKENK